MGDGTNMVIVLAGEMLKKAEELLRMGLKSSDIVQGYEKAQNFALKVLEGMFLLVWVGWFRGWRLLMVFDYRSRGRPFEGTSF